MTEPVWQEIIDPDALPGSPRIYWREFADGRQESCTENNPMFQEWLAAGNTPQPADS